jgi:hypothetical protein
MAPIFAALSNLAPILVGRVNLRKAGISVGWTELEVALKQQIASFEQEELGGSRIADPPTLKLLEEYALSEEDAFDLDSMAELAGLSPGAARRAWNKQARMLRTDARGTLLPGLRPYVRARLLVERGDRAGARPSSDTPSAPSPRSRTQESS